MTATPQALVPVFIGNFLVLLDVGQVQRLLMQDAIEKCPDSSRCEHYHFTGAALEGAWSTKRPIHLNSASDDQLEAVQASVNALIDKAMKGP